MDFNDVKCKIYCPGASVIVHNFEVKYLFILTIDFSFQKDYNTDRKRKGDKKMKCAICKNKTTWDESFGGEKFIICPRCYAKLNPNHNQDIHFALCRISILKEENKK